MQADPKSGHFVYPLYGKNTAEVKFDDLSLVILTVILHEPQYRGVWGGSYLAVCDDLAEHNQVEVWHHESGFDNFEQWFQD